MLLSTREGGGSIDVGLLSENKHKSNLVVGEYLMLTEGVVCLAGILLTPSR